MLLAWLKMQSNVMTNFMVMNEIAVDSEMIMEDWSKKDRYQVQTEITDSKVAKKRKKATPWQEFVADNST
eukprot:5559505-Karenia_brevis.AAC.1